MNYRRFKFFNGCKIWWIWREFYLQSVTKNLCPHPFLISGDTKSICNLIKSFGNSWKNYIQKFVILDFKFRFAVANKPLTETHYPVGIYMFRVNNRNTTTRCEICSKFTIKTPERCQWRRCGVLLLTLNIFHTLF